MSPDADWIDKMTWQDWIDRAALREQLTARLANARITGMCLCSQVEVATRIKWDIEFRERLKQRTVQS